MAKLTISGPRYRDLIADLKGKNRRKIGNNTWLELNAEARSVDIRLHSTVVARVFSDGTVSVNSGGYHSVTTKDRINSFLPSRYSLGQKNYEWFVYDRHNDWEPIPFHDHARFSH